jgi:hypothetical protein
VAGRRGLTGCVIMDLHHILYITAFLRIGQIKKLALFCASLMFFDGGSFIIQ